MSRETTVLVVNTHKIGRKSAENLTSEILTDELRGTIISPSISERANASTILKMRGSRRVPWPNGHSEPGTVEARYNGAAGITLRSSDLNSGSPVGKTRRAALKHRGLLEPRKGADFQSAS